VSNEIVEIFKKTFRKGLRTHGTNVTSALTPKKFGFQDSNFH
jgi:hypothetical protein